ncbi:hypothetical protein U27_03783 [Candidatus Vecturithrix granuli]|uniref:Uncharacterized protein n=1 Tax=Vecturithrix granuli TaxID=1499967 RepID=A0A081BWW4_VECG1|nr:hypothetical protein U27_03783 [Candidatus Vecturithrix granuli]
MNSTPLDMCNIDELVQLSPHALLFVYRASLYLFTATLQGISYCTSKTLLSLRVYLTELANLETKQTQSGKFHFVPNGL